MIINQKKSKTIESDLEIVGDSGQVVGDSRQRLLK